MAVGQTESFREFPGRCRVAPGYAETFGQQEILNCPSPYLGELP